MGLCKPSEDIYFMIAGMDMKRTMMAIDSWVDAEEFEAKMKKERMRGKHGR